MCRYLSGRSRSWAVVVRMSRVGGGEDMRPRMTCCCLCILLGDTTKVDVCMCRSWTLTGMSGTRLCKKEIDGRISLFLNCMCLGYFVYGRDTKGEELTHGAHDPFRGRESPFFKGFMRFTPVCIRTPSYPLASLIVQVCFCLCLFVSGLRGCAWVCTYASLISPGQS